MDISADRFTNQRPIFKRAANEELVMDHGEDMLHQFLMSAKDNPYLGPHHISLYLAIYSSWVQHKGPKPLCLFARQLMQVAKISGAATYHRCLKDLIRSGFVSYRPSFSRHEGSEFGVIYALL